MGYHRLTEKLPLLLRVSKQSSEAFTLHIASVNGGVQDNVAASPHVSVKHGDFATQLKRVNEALTEVRLPPSVLSSLP